MDLYIFYKTQIHLYWHLKKSREFTIRIV